MLPPDQLSEVLYGRSRDRWVTAVEVLAVVLVVGTLIALLLPVLNLMREAARRGSCDCNLKCIGLAFHNYNDANKRFPPAQLPLYPVTGPEELASATPGGFSWIVALLPMMEQRELYETVDIEHSGPYSTLTDNSQARSPEIGTLCDTLLPNFVCPSSPNAYWVSLATYRSSARAALTNYKVMGASHWQSLSMAQGWSHTEPLYLWPSSDKNKKLHPDGACPPMVSTRYRDFVDGLSHTILCVETIDDTAASLWCDGANAVCFGLNPYRADATEAFPAAMNPLTSDDFSLYPPHDANPLSQYYAPTNFNGHFGDEAATDMTVKPAAACDYRPARGRERGQYTFDSKHLKPGGGWGGPNMPHYGPSSGHNGVVNHLMADGSTKSFTRGIDPAAYFFMCTRNGGDPFWCPQEF